LIITLDTREKADLRKWIIHEFPKLTFKEEALKEGDILIECENNKKVKVLIERKTISDLYSSVLGSKGHVGRFPSQCSRLITHQVDSVVILLITGDVTAYALELKRKKNIIIDIELLNSIIAGVMTRYNIRVLINPDKYGGLKQAIKVGIKICEGELDLVAYRNLDALIARFLNITLVQWRNIREVYGTDLTYIANTADLAKIRGIGKVKERRIKELLCGKSDDWM
jgi:hypothetical protein